MCRFLLLALLGAASAQIPSLGWCPDYLPTSNFDINRFLGTWYEAVRYFTVSEIASRCVTTKYEKTPEGRVMVFNEITNSLTGLKRGIDGYLTLLGREGEGRFSVKFSSLPVPYDTEYSVLDTDYDNFALMWSCSGIGPVHTQNAWILTRDRLAPSAVMQLAYAAVDRYKLSRTFFVKTNQADCTVLPLPVAEPELKSADPEINVEGKHAGILNDVAELVSKVIEKPYGLSFSLNRDNGSSQFDFNILPSQDKIQVTSAKPQHNTINIKPDQKPQQISSNSKPQAISNNLITPKVADVGAKEPEKALQVPEIILSETKQTKKEKNVISEDNKEITPDFRNGPVEIKEKQPAINKSNNQLSEVLRNCTVYE